MSFLPEGWCPAADELSDKTLLITGASEGIGRAVAIECARRGAEVLLLARREALLDSVYDQIVTEGGRSPGIIAMDLGGTDPEPFAQLAQQLTASDVVLHGLIHNASLLGERRPLAHTSPDSWAQVMQTNIGGVFLLTRALMPLLEAAPAASVVLTSSGVGRKGKAYWGAYAVSKFATEGFMQVLADELAATSSIRVNSLNPGAVNTAMRRAAYPAEPPNTNPLPEDLTAHWVFLMSDASRALNGQALSVQG